MLTCDAKELSIPDSSFDMIVSLCAVEHFGLGRYGDDFDLQGDQKAFAEMVRVLKPGGRLVFTTSITRGKPAIAFNGHRIYSVDMVRDYCSGLKYEEERYFSKQHGRFCEFEDVTDKHAEWDVYCGCWIKM